MPLKARCRYSGVGDLGSWEDRCIRVRPEAITTMADAIRNQNLRSLNMSCHRWNFPPRHENERPAANWTTILPQIGVTVTRASVGPVCRTIKPIPLTANRLLCCDDGVMGEIAALVVSFCQSMYKAQRLSLDSRDVTPGVRVSCELALSHKETEHTVGEVVLRSTTIIATEAQRLAVSALVIPLGFALANSRTASFRNASPSWAFSFAPEGMTTSRLVFRPSPLGSTELVRSPPVSSVPNAAMSSASSFITWASEISCEDRHQDFRSV